ncbi:hypothetical protein [Nitrosophilus alvini]|uniref:hypothetical protein n=1 Tax=Nitrosophilus alvini TaxID=2714855 RepID=UPI00190AEEC9|nr:hypothetical protein [Nitrosophilus alvini]
MRLKKYTFFSLLLITLIGVFVYTQINEKYTLDIFGVPLTLPVAVWVVIPLLILYFASLFHMAFYSFKSYLHSRNLKKDFSSLIDSLYFAIFKEPKIHKYHTDEYAQVGEVTDRSEITLKALDYEFGNEKIKKAAETIKKIEDGNYVEIKDIKFSPDNPIYIKNIENKIASEPTYCGVILKKCEEFPKDLCKKALRKYIEFADLSQIKNYADLFDRDILFDLLKAAVKDENRLKISVDDILFFCQKTDMKQSDYIDLAKIVKKLLQPDERLQLFEKLKEQDEKAEAAYIYTLLDLEMVERAAEVLENSEEDEFLNFKAYLDLKNIGKNYHIELFI